ncbi:ergothioneine biosynthesis protein EgtC [Nocardia yunnanensis]|uniref:Ergothioneine biosynthesis protein EgtC n=1 Tax=Nocardia yunnanensis TaxID=2382165 RepID=A0A386ZM47_9NOCA|nr:ergothioneine biosynthesis protein EgtC [Nocardia yunnanensis]
MWHGGAPDASAHAGSAGAGGGVRAGTESALGPGPVAGETVAATDGTPSGAGELVVSRYRNAAPIWTDPAVEEVLPQIRSTAVLAAIRSATVGMPVERAACAPFTHGRWAFSHNGAIPDWRRVLTEVAAEFGSAPLLEAESLTDSAALWVILRDLLADSPDAEPAGATGGDEPGEALRRVMAAVLGRSPRARLNLLVGDGAGVWATTWHHALSVLEADEFVVVASEPFDDDARWRPIEDRQLVRVRDGRVSVRPLDIEIGRAGS